MPIKTFVLLLRCGLILIPMPAYAQSGFVAISSDHEDEAAVAELRDDNADSRFFGVPDVPVPVSNASRTSIRDIGAMTSDGQHAFSPQDTGAPPPTPPHTGLHALFHNLIEDVTKLPAMQNVYIAAAGGGLALAVHPADATFNAKLSGHWNTFFAPGKYVGDTPEQVAASLATFAFGRLTDKPKVSHLANDLLQAQILSEMLIEPLKFATQRLRPSQTASCGLNCSFPSGHATVTFADATVVLRHLGWRYSFIGYAIATYVAASRLHDNQHWLSDVVFGAAIGSIAGRTVVHHARDYWAFTPAPAPGGGVAILATRSHETN